MKGMNPQTLWVYENVCVCTCLLCGSQAVLGSAEDATDQAELIHGELCCFGAFFLLQQTADGKTPTVTAGSGERDRQTDGNRKK